jgi:hypothetical protein
LVKRARDIDYQNDCELEPASILLTTMVTHAYGTSRTATEGLTTAVAFMQHLAAMSVPPEIENPSNPGENLARRWKETPGAFPRFKRFAGRLGAMVGQWPTLAGMPQIAKSLANSFGEAVVTRAVRTVGSGVAVASTAGALGFSPGTTKLTSFPSPGTPAVPRHTFYGG